MATSLFANLSSLIGLKRAHGIDIKPTLLRVVTDLYIQKPAHPADHEREYAETILSLIERVDAETAEIVVNKLRAYANLAPALAGWLAAHGHAAIPAAPAPAAPPAPPVAANPAELFLAATPDERRRILAELDQSDIAAIEPPLDAPRAVRALESLALAGRPGDFIREIERSLALPRAVAQRIVNDASGEPTIVIAKALGMPIAVLQRILLFVNPSVGQSVRRVFALTALYDEFSRAAALKLVALWRTGPQPTRAAPPSARPAIADARAATPTARPAPAVEVRRQRTT